MSPISNAEKQARFRKKEELKKHVNQRYREAQMGIMVLGANEKAKLAQLQGFADLPSGWTDEDLDRAYKRVNRIFFDLIHPDRDLENDVSAARNDHEEFGRTPNPKQHFLESKKAVEDTRALSAHLISALELTKLSDGEKAAALAEAMRHVARTLIDTEPLHCSDANLLCLSTLPPNYIRPAWFNESFAKWITYRLGFDEAVNDLGQKILNRNFEI